MSLLIDALSLWEIGFRWAGLYDMTFFVKAGQSKNRKAISVPLTDDALVILQRQIGKHPTRVFTTLGSLLPVQTHLHGWQH